jgi:hypothetical protein
LLALKNHWSLNYRKVSNKSVLEKLSTLKRETFGFDSTAPVEEIERMSMKKTRDQLEKESERFQRGCGELLRLGIDFEPEYTFEQHIRKMVELIEDNEEIGAPIF